MQKFHLPPSIALWWQGLHKQMLLCIFILKAIGLIILASASPASSERIGAPEFSFILKQIMYIAISTPILLIISWLPERYLKILIFLGFICTLLLLLIMPIAGEEYKGARRWIYLYKFCLQPSEFLKPFYIFVVAHLLHALTKSESKYPHKTIIAISLVHLMIVVLLLLQPDFGMAMTISFIVAIQIFITGIRAKTIVALIIAGSTLLTVAIKTLPHVASRVNSFINRSGNVGYQVNKSLNSYISGGIYGAGIGEGKVKYQMPDSHSDFIFAVAGEEFGGLFCIIVISIFLYIAYLGFITALSTKNQLYALIIVGIHTCIAFQAIFNIGVTLNLLPTKGITLPFISYGGSTTLALDISIGIYLNISKRINSLQNKQPTFHAKY